MQQPVAVGGKKAIGLELGREKEMEGKEEKGYRLGATVLLAGRRSAGAAGGSWGCRRGEEKGRKGGQVRGERMRREKEEEKEKKKRKRKKKENE